MKRFLSFLLICLLFLIVIIGLTIWGAKSYLESDETKIIRNIPLLNQGELQFNEVDIDIFNSYPKAQFTLKDVRLYSPDRSYTKPILQFDSLKGFVEVKDLLKREIDINKIQLSGGSLLTIVEKSGRSNTSPFFNVTKKKKNKSSFLHFKTTPQSQFLLQNFSVHIIDSTKQNNLQFIVKDLNSDIQFNENDTSFVYDLEAFTNQLTFNWNKGPYLQNSNLKIKQGKIVLDNGNLKIAPTDTKINNYHYKISANIYSKQPEKTSELYIIQDSSNFEEIRSLLPFHIQKQLSKYEIQGHFKTNTKILFHNPLNPIVTIQFNLPGNKVSVKNQVFVNTKTDGLFRNRKYLDERALDEGRKNLRLHLNAFSGIVNGFTVTSPKGVVTYTPEEKANILFPATISGDAKNLRQFFKNEPFQFTKGNLRINTIIEGNLRNSINIIKKSDAKVEFNDLEIFYQPSQLRFPFNYLGLKKENNNATFEMIGNTFVTGNNYKISGEVNQFSDLFKSQNKNTTSKVKFFAKKIDWNDILKLFNNHSNFNNSSTKNIKNDSPKTKKIKQVVSALYLKFQPELDVQINELYYTDSLILDNVSTSIKLDENKKLLVDTTSFQVNHSNVKFTGLIDYHIPGKSLLNFHFEAEHLNLNKLLPHVNYFNVDLLRNFKKQPEDIGINLNLRAAFNDYNKFLPESTSGDIEFESGKDETFYGHILFDGIVEDSIENARIKTTASIHAEPKLINNLFENPSYVFNNGLLDLLVQYTGNIESLEQLIANADIELMIEQSEIEDKKSNVRLPISNFETLIHNNNASIKLSIYSDTLSYLDFDAKVKNISDLIYQRQLKNHEVYVNLYSPNIIWENFQSLFKKQPNEAVQKNSISDSTKTIAIKESVLSALTTFNPSVNLSIDKLSYMDEVQLNNIKSSISLKDTAIIKISNTGFQYLGGDLKLDAEAVLNNEKVIPYKGSLVATNFQIAELLENMDYFNLSKLEQIEELDGNINAEIELNGVYNENKQEIFDNNTRAVIRFYLKDVRIKGMPFIDSIAKKVLQKNRFADLQFAPIETTIYYDKGEFEIPFTEIQSNAIHLFVEAGITQQGKQSVWFTLPLRMLFHPGFECVPEKTENSQGRNRMFIELIETKDGDVKTRIHLSKKKFFKQRNIENGFNEYKEKMKKARKIRQSESN